MNFPFKKQIPQNTQNYPSNKVKEKNCRRIIKRDENGRIKEERFEGCSPKEMEMMRTGRSEEYND